MPTRTFCQLALLAALPLALASCSSGTKAGDTNVELGSTKKMQANQPQGTVNGDSLAAGVARDTVHRPTGKQLYKAADKAIDRNHDGLAD